MRLRELLDAHHDLILERWIALVSGRLAPRALPRPLLTDHMPEFLREVARAFATLEGGPHCQLPDRSPISQEHGSQRLMLGFDIGSVVAEFGTAAEVIWDLARERGVAVSLEEGKLLARCINTGIRDSAEQYSGRRDREQRELTTRHFAFLAHELRNPLQSVRLALRILEERGGVPPGRARDVLDQGLLRLQDLVDNTLISMKLSTGSEPIERSRLDLSRMVAELASDTALDREQRGLHLRLEVDPGASCDADPRLLRSAVGNLLRNAIKFSREAGTVTVRARRFGGRVLLEVEDECGGIAPEKIHRIFDPFVQAGADRSGFGLGLAIAKQAVEAHEGSLRVTNLPGKGCVFSLDLPLAPG